MRYATPVLLEDQCSYCRSIVERSATINCSVCQVISYCSLDHQSADWLSHEASCTSVQRARIESHEESIKLQAKCYQCFSIDDTEHDHSWEWKDIRSYVRAKYRFITALCNITTKPALRTAWYHGLEILRLNLCDNLDVKYLIPEIMMRLGMDVEAHEFIRRHRQVNPSCQYAWAHLDLVLPEPQHEDKNEHQAPIEWLDQCVPLPFKAALILLSLRMLLCLRDLENATLLGTRLPLELVHLVQDHLVTAAVVNDSRLWRDVRAGVSLRERIAALEKRLVDMFEVIKTQEPMFWHTLLQSTTSHEQTEPALNQSHRAWFETHGALDWVQLKVRSMS